jgi:hypothetical protein
VQVGRLVGHDVHHHALPLRLLGLPPLSIPELFLASRRPLPATNGPGWISLVVDVSKPKVTDPSDDGSSLGVVVSASLLFATAANQRCGIEIVSRSCEIGVQRFIHSFTTSSRSKAQVRPLFKSPGV